MSESFTITSVRIDYLTIPSILIPMTLTILVLGYRFHRYLRALNINTPLKKSILIYVTGLALAVTPVGSGQVIRSQIIKKQFGFAVSKTSPIILIEKWNELNAALLILVGLRSGRINVRIITHNHNRSRAGAIYFWHNEESFAFQHIQENHSEVSEVKSIGRKRGSFP